ncbi:MAG: hypothetical protein HKN87_04635 [Saprospiraceae bacterium]|nr:hypothetical protein [Saprospiraceae bacterium]
MRLLLAFLLLTFSLVPLSIIFGQTKQSLDVSSFAIEKEQAINQSAFTYSRTDTFSYDLKMVLDAKEIPKFYYTELITPVCETGQCHLVAIKVFWDLVGSYLRFELPADRVLTKLDHKHFEIADYDKLDRILDDPQWPLASYPLQQLIVDSTQQKIDDEIDAYTGATAPFVRKQDNIPGALYTIYTLWEFVYDEFIVGKLYNHTRKMIAAGQIDMEDLLGSKNKNYWRWAVELLQDATVEDNLYPYLWTIMRKGDQYLCYETLHLIEVRNTVVLRDLWQLFQDVAIEKKRDIIGKMEEGPVDDLMLIQMLEYLRKADDPMEQLILKKYLRNKKTLVQSGGQCRG